MKLNSKLTSDFNLICILLQEIFLDLEMTGW